ncbi:tetratricopeptide repeat protein [Alysiella filiformis]|uniref:Tetratricopeptide repeat-containing protein n=1 Tax=Alysiella filiformis DSM 16848 TaxID=1120981 RepID=A0A286ECY3_9NEIS|nr:hypothetical protein [Alysiella filiformis]QMT31886.1 hypothetical protein H3L97_03120 [Alysiella filiformis]UBQ57208.1 hypothetical protein JF568_05560 [Alysiella filiformis DSM 16848]SOD68684.1 hypothetical protein SAMN02746062_01353 [Alysiella filiformis DSM 16848]
MSTTFRQLKKIHQKAYATFDAGQLATATVYFQKLCRHRPDVANFHYMRGLVAKNRMDWQTSLSANLRAIELADEFDEAHHWNAAIAATALHDWASARQMWAACKLPIPDGTGEIMANFGITIIRLNAWDWGETVYAQRIDPVRAVILNVPFPESGWRCGDIVLHDGAPTGSRTDENSNEISVFNALERWQTSPKQTFTVFTQCESTDDVGALLDLCHQHNLDAEDWTENTRMICLQCSYGRVHEHHHNHKSANWQSERSIGIAANSLAEIEKTLNEWQGKNRQVLEICQQDYPIPERKDGWVWWI